VGVRAPGVEGVDGFLGAGGVGVEGVFGGVYEGDGVFELWGGRLLVGCFGLDGRRGIAGCLEGCGGNGVVVSLPQVFMAVPMVAACVVALCGVEKELGVVVVVRQEL